MTGLLGVPAASAPGPLPPSGKPSSRDAVVAVWEAEWFLHKVSSALCNAVSREGN